VAYCVSVASIDFNLSADSFSIGNEKRIEGGERPEI